MTQNYIVESFLVHPTIATCFLIVAKGIQRDSVSRFNLMDTGFDLKRFGTDLLSLYHLRVPAVADHKTGWTRNVSTHRVPPNQEDATE